MIKRRNFIDADWLKQAFCKAIDQLSSASKDMTPDGYRIVPMKDPVEKGVMCGHCGMKFEHGKAVSYTCPYSRCPVFPKAGNP